MRRRRPRIGRWWWATAICIVGGLVTFWIVGCGHSKPNQSVTMARPILRVRVVDRADQVKFVSAAPPTIRSAGGPPRKLNLPDKTAINIGCSPAGWTVGAATLPPGELIIEPATDGTIAVDGVIHRGSYHFVPAADGKTFDVINHVDIESYLKGVLARELYVEFEQEAYTAQAITSRTYALYVAKTAPAGRAWDLHADTKSQMYGGLKAETAKSIKAVDDTAGLVLVHGPSGQEKIFKAYFSACCGGATASVQDTFHEPPIEPLQDQFVGPRCDTTAGRYHSKFSWGPVVVSKEELGRRFRAFGKSRSRPEKDMATIQKIDIFRANASGRPVQFMVTDTRGATYVISGEELRLAVNTSAPSDSILYSGFVTPVTEANAIRFTNGRGHGHGVGLCQWCAQAQAKAGVAHEQIVLSAYRGAKIMRVY